MRINFKTTRAYATGIHIAIAMFQLTFIYTPLHEVPHMFTVVQWISTPLLIISGFWLTFGKRFFR